MIFASVLWGSFAPRRIAPRRTAPRRTAAVQLPDQPTENVYPTVPPESTSVKKGSHESELRPPAGFQAT